MQHLDSYTFDIIKGAVRKRWIYDRNDSKPFGLVVRDVHSTQSATVDIRLAQRGGGSSRLASYHAFVRADGSVEIEARG